MARKADRRCLLDTSAVIYKLHGHTLQKAAVEEAVAGGTVEVPVFVRMEYLRGVVVNLIDLHSLIKESVTVEDALIDWAQLVRQERRLKVVLLTVSRWLSAQDDSADKDRSLDRLGNYLLNLIWSFDEAFPQPAADPLACVLGRVTIEKQDYADELLLDFYERFRAIRQGVPECNLCGFRKAQRQRLRRRKIDLTGEEARRRHAGNPGFLRQADVLREADATKDRTPSCRWCERLGDSLIALQAGRGVRVVTADRIFDALGELLGVPVVRLPSLAELKRRASTPTEVPGEQGPPVASPDEAR
jgi:predicted nucleic acid-binding protein